MNRKEHKFKIYHGPVNICGIGRYIADWQRKRGAISDFVTYQDYIITQDSHLNLHLEKYSLLKRILIKFSFLITCLIKYDLFHFYFGKSFLLFNFDMPILRLFKKKIIMTYCGSEVRLIEVERKRNPYNHLLKISIDDPKYDLRKKFMMQWQMLWVDRFIAIRNLYDSVTCVIPKQKVEKDIWVNNTMDLDAYCPQEYETKEIPVLIHAPSEKGIKGTKYVEKAIEELKQEGYKFEYRQLHNVLNTEAQRIYKEDADIIIDQFLLGGFGNLAVEAMYYGKPVLCYLIDEVKEEHYPDCPIVNANIDNLKEKLAWLIENPNERIRLGKEGRVFVEQNFDREEINKKLWNMYQLL